MHDKYYFLNIRVYKNNAMYETQIIHFDFVSV